MLSDLDLSDLSLENVGSWPEAIRIAVWVIIFIGIIGLGYTFDTQKQIKQLANVNDQEKTLRKEFEVKQHRAANLELYKNQIATMRKIFGAMLRKLPSENEVPGLLEDISKHGVASGLVFTLFAPEKELQHDFYAELPIRVEVLGDYHHFAQFVSRLSGLSRIVTLHDLKIEKMKYPPERNDRNSIRDRKTMKMSITAKTYHYTEPNWKGKD